MTLTLAIVTSTPQVSVALGEPGGDVFSVHARGDARHGEVLAPAIQFLTRTGATSLREVGLVAVDAGPGLFTGLRVGVATAKAIASALRVPLAAGSSLDLVARPHRYTGALVVPVVDARRSEVFWSIAGQEPAVAPPEAVAEALALRGGPMVIVGDGARRYQAQFESIEGAVLPDRSFDHPSATTLLEMAAELPVSEPEKVTPLYIRGADVRIGWTERSG